MVPQRPWGGIPTPLGRYPNALGEVSQRPWGGIPTPLGRYPNALGRYPQRRWEGSPTALGRFPNGVGNPCVVPSCLKPLSIIEYEVEEDNSWNTQQYSVVVILSCRGRWFWERMNLMWEALNLMWETLNLGRCFSVDANPLQRISESGLAVESTYLKKTYKNILAIKNKCVPLHFQK